MHDTRNLLLGPKNLVFKVQKRLAELVVLSRSRL